MSAGDDGPTGGGQSDEIEILSSPYLFKSARPTITSAPAQIGFGAAARTASGKIGRAIDFDGVNDVYALYASTAANSPQGERTTGSGAVVKIGAPPLEYPDVVGDLRAASWSGPHTRGSHRPHLV